LCIKIRVKSIELSYVRNQNIFQWLAYSRSGKPLNLLTSHNSSAQTEKMDKSDHFHLSAHLKSQYPFHWKISSLDIDNMKCMTSRREKENDKKHSIQTQYSTKNPW
jgi:hypothetical protein